VSFRLIDELEECVPGESAVSSRVFSAEDPIFEDHFPGRPMLPGVLQIELIAQTAGACVRSRLRGVRSVLAGVDSARFRTPIEPGELCRIEVEITDLRARSARARGVVSVAGERRCAASILIGLLPHAEFEGES
jgi:3-hydroxyacyl-[acyl-carrier-protein] dehydratase